jgi:hypothetical protein
MIAEALLVLIAVLSSVYFGRFRSRALRSWTAQAAWLRAFIYFSCCLLVADLAGAIDLLIYSPLTHPGQLSSSLWWLSTAAITLFILVAYWGYWHHHTLRFDRKLAPISQLAFGLCWGVSSGLLMLAIWQVSSQLTGEISAVLTWVLAFALISTWQALFMDMYWNIYISPEHDTPESFQRKLVRTHVPNMVLSLTYLAVYQNYLLFVGLQTLALVAAAYGVRMPPPWSKAEGPAARQVPGLFGLPRGGGHIE